VNGWYHLGLMKEKMGEVQEAARCYNQALILDPYHTSSRTNIAGLHHNHGSRRDGVDQYLILVSQTVKREVTIETLPSLLLSPTPEINLTLMGVINNIGAALIMMGRPYEGVRVMEAMVLRLEGDERSSSILTRLLNSLLLPNPPTTHKIKFKDELESEEDIEFLRVYFQTLIYLHHGKREGMNWKWLERIEGLLIYYSLLLSWVPSHTTIDLQPPLLPFDTLLLGELTMPSRQLISASACPLLSSNQHHTTSSPLPIVQREEKIRMAFIGYDFSDHPTSHLLEGLLVHLSSYS